MTGLPETRAADDAIVAQALAIVRRRLRRGAAMTTPDQTRAFLTLELTRHEHEVFAALWLDTRHRLITYEPLARGTLDGASVYPREVVKRALKHNAAAVIFAHNHPSGDTTPSKADVTITSRLKESLDLVGVRLLDHLIVGEDITSLAERGDL